MASTLPIHMVLLRQKAELRALSEDAIQRLADALTRLIGTYAAMEGAGQKIRPPHDGKVIPLFPEP